MSTESKKTVPFLKSLRSAAPDAVVTKYNDRITNGLPDASLTRHGRTVWMEFKARPEGHHGSVLSLVAKSNRHGWLQLVQLYRHDVASEGRAFLVVFEPDRDISLYRVTSPYLQTAIAPVTRGCALAIRDYLLKCCDV